MDVAFVSHLPKAVLSMSEVCQINGN